MDKKKLLTVIGIIAITAGSLSLYFAGSTQDMITTLVATVFIVIGVISAFFK